MSFTDLDEDLGYGSDLAERTDAVAKADTTGEWSYHGK